MMRGLVHGIAFWAAAGLSGCDSRHPAHVPILPDECEIDAHCTDGVACTEDLCVISVNNRKICAWIPRSERCGHGQTCQVIGPGLSGCMFDSDAACLYAIEGTPCQAADDSCALGSGKCAKGRCDHPRKNCPNRPCRRQAGCEPGGGRCRYEPFADGTACDADHSDCTTDVCVTGRCRSGTNHCVCERDSDCPSGVDVCWGRFACDSRTGTCVRKGAKVCEDPAPCQIGVCNPKTAECEPFPAEDDDPCGPLDACRTAGACLDGACHDTALDCDDANPCTVDGCDPGSGCTHAALDGPECDDGDACTAGDTCRDGVCRPGPALDCNDHEPCTDDACDPTVGCVRMPRMSGPCEDEDPCTRTGTCEDGKCRPGPPNDCDDSDACTLDSCVAGLGCEHNPLTGSPCEDGEPCTAADTCVAGVCSPGPARDCSDGDVCTTDACVSGFGCTHAAVDPSSCDDANPCTVDACVPASGCVHDMLSDCCGNGVVEPGEECDTGPAGTNVCSPLCAIQILDLVSPPDKGRGLAMAWSDNAQIGMLAYERVTEKGDRLLGVQTLSASGVLGPFLPIPDANPPDSSPFLPTMVAEPGTSRFVVLFYGQKGMEAVVVDPNGPVATPVSLLSSDGLPDSGFFAVQGPSGFLVATHFRVLSAIPDNPLRYSEVRSGRIQLEGNSLFLGELWKSGGDPSICESTAAGGLCRDGDNTILTLSFRRKTAPFGAVAQIVPVNFMGKPGNPVELASCPVDFLIPPLCAVRKTGGFQVVYGLPGTGEAGLFIDLYSQAVAKDGQKVGAPTRLFPPPPASGPNDLWLAMPARLLAIPAGFRFVSPRAIGSDFQTFSAVRLGGADLDEGGVVMAGPYDIAPVPDDWPRVVAGVSWPPGHTLLGWQEGAAPGAEGLDPGGRVRVVVRPAAP